MDYQQILRRLQEEPEWLVLGVLAVVLIGGGGAFYYSQSVQSQHQTRTDFNRAMSAYTQGSRSGQYEEAIRRLRRFLQDHPESPMSDRAHFFLGKSYFERGDYSQAQTHLHRVVQDHPGSRFADGARLHLAYAMAATDRNESAIEWLRPLTERSPSDPLWAEAMWKRGLYLRELGKPGQARQTFRAIVEKAPSEAEFWVSQAKTMLTVRADTSPSPS